MSMLLSAVMSCAMVAPSAATGTFVQVRDAVGGEFASGNPGGFYLSGTGGRPRMSVDGNPFALGFTGVFDFEIDTGGGNGWESFLTFCIQPREDIPFGYAPGDTVGATYEIVPLAGHNGYDAVRAHQSGILWANAFALSQIDNVHAAAFQAVVWELAEDTDYDLLSGNYRLDPGHAFTSLVYTLAQSWLDNILGGAWTDSVQLAALKSERGQDLLIVVPGPGALALLLAAGGTAGARRRRRR